MCSLLPSAPHDESSLYPQLSPHVGLPASIPLGSVGGAFALASSGLIIASKKLDSKIKKHQEIVALASPSETLSAGFIPKLWPIIIFLTASFS